MRPARPAPAYIRQIPVKPLSRIELRTNDTVKNEVFGSLEFLSEVEEVGKKFLQDRGHTLNIHKSYLQLQSFVRQAKTFYDAAEVLHYRASTLNYYYSFLNLVKAYICLSEPAYVDGRVGHGLTHDLKGHRLSRQFVVAQRSGVFPKFYKLVTGRTLSSGTRLKIVDLLGYCSDVGLEYQQAGFGLHRNLPCKYAVIVNRNEGKAFPLLAIVHFEQLEKFRLTLATFTKYFEEVDFHKGLAREVFDISAEVKQSYRFFESRNEYKLTPDGSLPAGDIVRESYHALEKLFISNPYGDGFDFLLAQPLRRNLQIPLNEIVAITRRCFSWALWFGITQDTWKKFLRVETRGLSKDSPKQHLLRF